MKTNKENKDNKDNKDNSRNKTSENETFNDNTNISKKNIRVTIKFKIYLTFILSLTSLGLLAGTSATIRYQKLVDEKDRNIMRNCVTGVNSAISMVDQTLLFNTKSISNKRYQDVWYAAKFVQKSTKIIEVNIYIKDENNIIQTFISTGNSEIMGEVMNSRFMSVNPDRDGTIKRVFNTKKTLIPNKFYRRANSKITYMNYLSPVIIEGDVVAVIVASYSVNESNSQKRSSFLIVYSLVFACLLLGFGLGEMVSRMIINPIMTMISNTEKIKQKDLTFKFDIGKRNDEFNDLAFAFTDTVETLKILIQKVYIAIIVMNKNLRTLFISSNIVAESANAQAVTVEETVSSFEKLNSMVETISNESAKANNYTVQALEKGKIGMESMKKLELEMNKIEASSVEITEIIEMINDIAEQTNLLSLNASIESARAGEAGKGFNIVAGEVRKLAEKSTQAANRINELINNNNKIIKEGVNYSKETTKILKDIAISNELITGLVKTITEEVHKVKFSSSEILRAVNHISEIAQANLTQSESVSSAMDDFVDQTIELQKFVGQFDVRTDKIKENQVHIEKILDSKLTEANKLISSYGFAILPSGKKARIGNFDVPELQIGTTLITGNPDLVDNISKKTNTSVTLFQPVDDLLVRVSTTVRNFDNSRAVGTSIDSSSAVYQQVMSGKKYFGRAFVVNRWYVAVYDPLMDETGNILGVVYLGLPEEMETTATNKDANIIVDDGTIVKDDSFKKIEE